MVWAMIGRFFTILVLALAWTASAHAQTEGRPARVVVELFTSQGCIQCPRANRLLGGFSRQDDALALTFPVGIWDYLGWHDTLALPEFSERHRSYTRAMRARRSTPQLVLNGATPLSASDWDDARAVFNHAHERGMPASAPTLALRRQRNGRVTVEVGAGQRDGAPADVWLAAYDGGPITVFVRGGANINRSVPHYNLVRRIDRIGVWSGEPATLQRARCSPKCAAILQEPEGGPILAATFID
ncbi:MAG: DUF1223 domain-containing protein [Hyphomonadaceae bacterium]|nr:DUF1223 domain-containing protein [Hyphomonadaceae bacterium]